MQSFQQTNVKLAERIEPFNEDNCGIQRSNRSEAHILLNKCSLSKCRQVSFQQKVWRFEYSNVSQGQSSICGLYIRKTFSRPLDHNWSDNTNIRTKSSTIMIVVQKLDHHTSEEPPNPWKNPNSNRYRKSRGSAVKYVTSSINSFGFQGLWAHIYEDILHAINGPATRVYHHIIIWIQTKFKNSNRYTNSRISAVNMSPQA